MHRTWSAKHRQAESGWQAKVDKPCNGMRGLQIRGRPGVRVMSNTVQIPGSGPGQHPLTSVTLSISFILGVCLLASWLTLSHPSNLFTRPGMPYHTTSEHSLFCTKLCCFNSFIFLKGLEAARVYKAVKYDQTLYLCIQILQESPVLF